MVGIRRHIDAAIAASGITTLHHAVNFPGNGQQLKFRADMAKILPGIL
ncbi:hypothetical protein [Gemmobacter serpentinus]|nr:hypothetical protein [Gemmobacter serpentinus]